MDDLYSPDPPSRHGPEVQRVGDGERSEGVSGRTEQPSPASGQPVRHPRWYISERISEHELMLNAQRAADLTGTTQIVHHAPEGEPAPRITIVKPNQPPTTTTVTETDPVWPDWMAEYDPPRYDPPWVTTPTDEEKI